MDIIQFFRLFARDFFLCDAVPGQTRHFPRQLLLRGRLMKIGHQLFVSPAITRRFPRSIIFLPFISLIVRVFSINRFVRILRAIPVIMIRELHFTGKMFLHGLLALSGDTQRAILKLLLHGLILSLIFIRILHQIPLIIREGSILSLQRQRFIDIFAKCEHQSNLIAHLHAQVLLANRGI